MFAAVFESGKVATGETPEWLKPVTFVMHQVVQPWHPHGTYVHEAALAVKEVAPECYPAYLLAVYTAFDAGMFKDDTTWDKTRP